MIKAGDTIKIRWSTQLDNLGASNLVGKKALVVNAAYSENGVVGVIVKVKKLKNSERSAIFPYFQANKLAYPISRMFGRRYKTLGLKKKA